MHSNRLIAAQFTLIFASKETSIKVEKIFGCKSKQLHGNFSYAFIVMKYITLKR